MNLKKNGGKTNSQIKLSVNNRKAPARSVTVTVCNFIKNVEIFFYHSKVMDHISVYGLMLIKYVWCDVVLLLQN